MVRHYGAYDTTWFLVKKLTVRMLQLMLHFEKTVMHERLTFVSTRAGLDNSGDSNDSVFGALAVTSGVYCRTDGERDVRCGAFCMADRVHETTACAYDRTVGGYKRDAGAYRGYVGA